MTIRTRARKLRNVLILLVACWLFAELLAFFGLRLVDGRWWTPGRLAAERARLTGEEVAAAPGKRRGERTAELLDLATSEEVLHPFLGYVVNPELNNDPARQRANGLKISEHGFFRVSDPPASPGQEEVRIGVFGGSVAFLFAFEGRRALFDVLAQAPELRGKTFSVRCYALGGYKQPQQSFALAWALVLGEELDLVINLDGFNDVALPWADNVDRRMFPFYPRNWDSLVRKLDNPGLQRRAGLVVYLEGRRSEVAAAFSRRPLAASPLAGLVWRSRDRALERRIAAAREDLAGSTRPGRRYRIRGPRRRFPSEEALFSELAAFWGRCSLQMASLCRAHGIRYFHFLQPNQYVAGSKPMGASERAVAFHQGHAYQHPVEVGYPHLRRVGEELRRQGVAFFDLTGVFAEVEEPLYWDDCCHVNSRGSELLGEAMGRAIVAELAKGGPAFGSLSP